MFISKKDNGVIESVADGIVNISGLTKAYYGEMIHIFTENNSYEVGLVLSLEIDLIKAVILGDDSKIKVGQTVESQSVLMSVPVSNDLLGRVVNPLGEPLDGKPIINATERAFLEEVAPSIISRSPINVPLETGLKVVDSLVPIGHGQRELIIGDSKTGKTSIALDAILNQKDFDTISIYVSIGQKRSSIARILNLFTEKGCLNSTIIVAATASDSAGLQYIAPYSGCSIGEYFMNKGLPVLAIYDDLSKHAVSYRQLSLLLRRPPGREGYPGDVFFLHSRLLERSSNLQKAGSLTALPIIETIQSDVSAYIPTNVISITDGQIFLDTDLFSKGVRPSVSPGLSVSRVGSAAQNKVLKGLAGSLKLELAQFYEVEAFSKLGFALDSATKRLIDRGERLIQGLIQDRFLSYYIPKQILFLYSIIGDKVSWMPKSYVGIFEKELQKYLAKSIYIKPLSIDTLTRLNVTIVDFFVYYFISSSIKFFRKFYNFDLA